MIEKTLSISFGYKRVLLYNDEKIQTKTIGD